MRTFKLLLTLLLLLGLSSTTFSQTSIEDFPTLAKALKNPAATTQLKIEAGSSYLEQFEKQVGSFTSLEEVCILGFNNLEELEAVIDNLTQVPSLKKVIAPLKRIDDLPANIHLLDQVSTLEIIPSANLKRGNYDRLKEQQIKVDFVTYDNDKVLTINYYSTRPKLRDADVIHLVEVFPNAVLDEEAMQQALAATPQNDPPENSDLAGMPFKKEYQNITPPIKGVDVTGDIYKVPANRQSKVVSASGTEISIPANCFVDKSGRPVKGDVQLDYREFRDPVDILASGIPMSYDSGGVMNNFESAGMFELLASQNGQELFMAPDKQVDMKFSSTNASPTFNFYEFNDESGNWEYKDKAGSPSEITTQMRQTKDGFEPVQQGTGAIVTPMSPAYLKFQDDYKPVSIRDVDSTEFAERFDDPNYFFTYDRLEGEKRGGLYNDLVKYRNMEEGARGKKRAKRYLNKSSVLEVKRWKGEKERKQIWFKLKFKSSNFPELINMKSLVWVYAGNMSKSDFRKYYMWRAGISDVRLEFLEGEDLYELTFKTIDGEKKMKAYPRYSNMVVGEERARARYPKFNKSYNKRLDRKEYSFDKRVHRAKNKYHKSVKRNYYKKYRAWSASRNLMSETEKRMSFEAWMDYYEKVQKTLLRGSLYNTANAPVIRNLRLSGFGVFNCDIIRSIIKPGRVLARYQNQKGEDMAPVAIYVIDEKLNGLIRYDGFRDLSPFNFLISRSSRSTILAIDAEGKLSYITKEEVEALDLERSNKFLLKMNEIDCGISDVQDLRSVLGV